MSVACRPPESLDTLLTQMMPNKLPDETKRNMARDHTSAEWTVLELQAAIRNEIRILETGQQPSLLCSHQGDPQLPSTPQCTINNIQREKMAVS